MNFLIVGLLSTTFFLIGLIGFSASISSFGIWGNLIVIAVSLSVFFITFFCRIYCDSIKKYLKEKL